MLDRPPSRRDLEASATVGDALPCVDTERAQNPRSAWISATQRSPRIPGTPAMTAPLAGGGISTSATSHNGD
jgi:hypothetical protein